MKTGKVLLIFLLVFIMVISGSTGFALQIEGHSIRTYTSDNKDYVEIVDDFNDNSLDTNLWSRFYTSGATNDGYREANGRLEITGTALIKLVDNYNEYDYVEIQIDQLGKTVEKGGIGFSTNGYWNIKYSFIQRLYDGKNYTYDVFLTHNHENGWGNLGKSFNKVGNYLDYTTVIKGYKNSSTGKFDVYVDIYNVGNTSGTPLMSINNASDNDYHKIYDFGDVYLGKNMGDKTAYLDNFHLVAYKNRPLEPNVSNIKKYEKDYKQYVEVTDNFNDGTVDTNLWSSFYAPNAASSFSESNGKLNITNTQLLKLTESYKDYDYIEIQVDQLGQTVEKGGIGFSTNGYWNNKYSFIQRLYDGDNYTYDVFLTHNHENGWGNLGKSFNKVGNYLDYTTVIKGYKNSSTGKFDVYVDIYNVGNTSGTPLMSINNASDNDYHKIYDFGDVYLGKNMGDETAYLDNFHLVAYKNIPNPVLSYNITGLTATTSTDKANMHLSWNAPTGVTFDSYKLVATYPNGQSVTTTIPKDATSKDLPINGNKGNVQFELSLISGANESPKATTTWIDNRLTLTVDFYSSKTGEKISTSTLYQFANGSVNVALPANYTLTGKAVDNTTFAYTVTANKTLNVMCTPNSNITPSSTNAIATINDISNDNKADFHDNSYYDDLFNNNDDILNQKKADILSIIKQTGVLRVVDDYFDDYYDEIVKEDSVDTVDKLQVIIDRVNGRSFASFTQQEITSSGYSNLINSKKSAFYASELGYVLKTEIRQDTNNKLIYEFDLVGNNYFKFQDSLVKMVDEEDQLIDANISYKYVSTSKTLKFTVEPIDKLKVDKSYYIIVDSKLTLTSDYTVDKLKKDTKNDELFINDWELRYYINQIEENHPAISNDLAINTTIKSYNESNVLLYEHKYNLGIDFISKPLLPGGF